MECHTRCKTKYDRVEKGFTDLQDLETDTWEGDNEELDEYLTKMDTESEACFNQFSEVQHSNTELFSWHVGLKKSQEDPIVFQLGDSITKSKKRCSKLVNQKGKIEKQLPKDDTNGTVLQCKK